MPTRRALLTAAIASTMIPESVFAAADESVKLDLSVYDKIEPVKYPWGWLRWLMSDQIDPKAELTLGIVYVEPRSTNQLHIHPNSAEILHVLSGSCEHRRGDEWIKLKAGDTLRIPKNTPHMARTQDQSMLAMLAYDTGKRVMVPVEDKK